MAKQKKQFKVGTTVQTFVRLSNTDKIKVVGKIKKVYKTFGRNTYVITGGVVSDFPTRTVK